MALAAGALRGAVWWARAMGEPQGEAGRAGWGWPARAFAGKLRGHTWAQESAEVLK